MVFTLFVALIWGLVLRRRGWPIVAVMYSFALLAWFFPKTTLARCRIYVWLLVVESILLGAIGWWYSGWGFGLSLGLFTFLFSFFLEHHRLSIFRKLESGQTYSRLAGEPQLTHTEALVFHRLQNGEPYENISSAIFLLIVTALTVWLPATFSPWPRG